MSTDVLKERANALEDQYFDKMNKEAMARLKEKRVLKSPISGEPMEQVTVMGVNIDRCVQSGGVWLDAGELEQIIKGAQGGTTAPENNDWATNFFGKLFKTK